MPRTANGAINLAFISLGNLRLGRAPSQREARLSQFFFGVEPEPPLAVIKPIAISVNPDHLLIADVGFAGVLKFMAGGRAASGLSLSASLDYPVAVASDEAGMIYVADSNGSTVSAFGDDGKKLWTFRDERTSFRPGDLALHKNELFVSNTSGHNVLVLDAVSGAVKRSFGTLGRGQGQFRVPLGIAISGDEVFVVDVFARRVQIFDVNGSWKRELSGEIEEGQRLSRPKDVVVGPDGTIFVSDATAGVVHAFNSHGKLLTTLGDPNGDDNGLALPAGLAIARTKWPTARQLPTGYEPSYYVLVCEQLEAPGVRVFAWRGVQNSADVQFARSQPNSGTNQFAAKVANPHWSALGCRSCHGEVAPRTIQPAAADTICLSCHDGIQASSEPHPIGWPADSAHTRAPADWPLDNGRIACITCHDVKRHCTQSARRPARNSAMVRDYDAAKPLDFCTKCHVAQEWQFNPHRQSESTRLSGANSCVLCHTTVPTTNTASAPRDSFLHQTTTALCLNCHVEHSDPAPTGHLGKQQYVNAESARTQELPLESRTITCATCHNPHPPNIGEDANVGSRATRPEDAAIDLRMNYENLCTACHQK